LYIESSLTRSLDRQFSTDNKDSTSGGGGHLQVTGHLGDVMKESAQIAHTVAKTYLAQADPDNDFLQRAHIHVHVPEVRRPLAFVCYYNDFSLNAHSHGSRGIFTDCINEGIYCDWSCPPVFFRRSLKLPLNCHWHCWLGIISKGVQPTESSTAYPQKGFLPEQVREKNRKNQLMLILKTAI